MLRRRSRAGRAAGHPGRRPVAPLAQPSRSGRTRRRPAPLLPARGATGPGTGPAAEQAHTDPETGLAARTRVRHAEIHAALARRLTITPISRTLRLERKTVRRYATAAIAEELTGGARLARPGLLDPHLPYLRQRWDQGVRSTERLYQELRDRGYRGSLRTLRPLTARLRRDTAVPAPPPAPAARKVAS